MQGMKTSSIMAIQIIIRAAGAIPGNLFAQTSKHYVNPAYQAELDTSIATATGSARQTLEVMRSVPSAYWIDTKAKVRGNTTSSLEGILADAASKSPPPLVVAILYNLPNRDCDSSNSRGEICCTYKADGSCDYIKAGDCQAGLDEYKHQYVDPFAELLKRYAHVPTAVIVEPDSLPNLATNKQNPKCANSATAAAYTLGIPYAVHALATANPKAALYLDAAHGGWLGWPNNAQAYATLLATLRVSDKLRGLSSNVANYQGVGTPCPASAFDDKMHNWCAGAGSGHACCEDPCGLLAQWSAGNNEYNYVQAMSREIARAIPAWKPHWLIDSGRAGVSDARQDCSNWCNPRGTGVGLEPTAKTALPGMVDALYWLKTPGESDGCTQTLPDGSACGRFDPMCASADSIGSRANEPRAPVAGTWFDYQVKMLATNGHLHTASSSFTSTTAAENRVEGAAAKPITKTSKAFAACDASSECAAGYTCEVATLGVCMPTEETVQARGHDGAFATRLVHALRMAAAKEV